VTSATWSAKLMQHGYRISLAESAVALRRLLERSAPDLVVLDIMMPGEDGLSLCRHLRSTTELPVILLTAMAEETDRIVGLEVGADDYVTKPFNPRELLARIKAVLRRVQSCRRRKAGSPVRPSVSTGGPLTSTGASCWETTALPCRSARRSSVSCAHFSTIRAWCSAATSSLTSRSAEMPIRSTGASTIRSAACGRRSRPTRKYLP